MRKYYIRIVYLVAFLGGLSNFLLGQCSYSGVTLVPASSTAVIPLEISGALNNDLSLANQCVAAITLNFDHPRLSFFDISLISPAGDTVRLVSGDGGVFNPTILSNWDVTFLPCGQIVLPDVGFAPVFDNTASWGLLSSFNGQYYPSSGCLEDFNRGPVNGTWRLILNNNSITDEIGRLRGFTIFFCDGSQIDCNLCEAAQSEIRLDNSSFCINSPALLLNINRTFIGGVPDSDNYSFDYIILEDDRVVDLSSFPDLRAYPTGQYSICGISYETKDISSLPIPGSIVNINSLRADLLSNREPFCARISNCIPIAIQPRIDTTFLTKFLCKGDSIQIGSQFYDRSGIFTETFFRQGLCDSIVVLDLTVLDFEFNNPGLVTLDCSQSSSFFNAFDFIDADVIVSELLEFVWSSVDFSDTISTSNIVEISESGSFALHVNSSNSDLQCRFIYIIDFVNPSTIFPSVQYQDTLCIQSLAVLTATPDIPQSEYLWFTDPPQVLIGPSDSSQVTIQFDTEGLFEVCVQISSECITDTTICNSIFVTGGQSGQYTFDDAFCELSAIVLTDIINIDSLRLIDGPGNIELISFDESQFECAVSEPGIYVLEINWNDGFCQLKDTLTLSFESNPITLLSLDSIDSCFEKDFYFVVESNVLGDFSFLLNGVRFTVELSSGLNEIFLTEGLVVGQNTLDQLEFHSEEFSCDFSIDSLFTFSLGTIGVESLNPTICNNTLDGNQSVLNFSDLFGDFQIISIRSSDFPDIDFLPVSDFDGFVEGSFIFIVTLYKDESCPELEIQVRVSISDCSCPSLIETIDNAVFCVNGLIDLAEFVTHDQDLVWEVVSAPIGSIFQLNGSLFSVTSSSVGTYSFAAYVMDSELCSDTLLFGLVGVSDFYPGNVLSDTVSICLRINQSTINLFDFISAYDSGGFWQIKESSSSGFILNGFLGHLTISNVTEQSFTVEYGVANSGIDDCTLNRSQFVLNITRFDFTDIVTENILSCNEVSIDIDIGNFVDKLSSNFSIEITPVFGEFSFTEPFRRIVLYGESMISAHISSTLTGCTDSVFISSSFDFPPIESVFFNVNTPLCYGPSMFASLDINEIVDGSSPFSFKVMGVDSNMEFGIDSFPAGNMSLIVEDGNGCVFDTNFVAQFPDRVFMNLEGTINTGEIQEFEVELTISLPENLIDLLEWYVNGTFFAEDIYSIRLDGSQNVSVSALIEDINGCIYRDSILLGTSPKDLYFLPNAFSPNGDGINDILYIYPVLSNFSVISWEIFDRWGELIFAQGNFQPATIMEGWDGTFKGKLLDSGLFISHIRYIKPDGTFGSKIEEVVLLR